MSVLEDFWYGNIEPSEYDTSSAKEYKEALLRISRNEESLQDTLTDAQRKLFAQYLDSVREFQAMAECLLFQNSFRLGARMMLEIMDEYANHPRHPADCQPAGCHIIDYAGNPSQKVRRIFSSPGIHIILWIRKIPVLLLRHTLIFSPSHLQRLDTLDSPKQL